MRKLMLLPILAVLLLSMEQKKQCCGEREIETVRQILEVDRSYLNSEFGNTPVYIAARKGNLDLVKYLIEEKDADFKTANKEGGTPVFAAAANGRIDVVKYLVGDKKANFETATKLGKTPVHAAAGNGHIDVVKYLVGDKKADFETTNKDKETSVHAAAQSGNLDLVKYLVEDKKADINTANKDKETLVHLAAKSRHLDVVKYLVEDKKVDFKATNRYGYTPVHAAAAYGNLRVVKYLVDKGADFNTANNIRSTPVHTAAQNGKLEVLKYLVGEKKADFDAVNNQGWTPVFVAAKNGKLDVLEYLVDKGADIKKASNFGSTPVCIAAQNGKLEVLKYLVEKGADINTANNLGFTPVYCAKENGNNKIVEFLKNHEENKVAEYLKWSIHSAAECGRLDVVRYFVEDKKANFNAANSKKETPVFVAAMNGHLHVVKYLVDKGADITTAKKFGNTAVHAAAQKGHLHVVEYLVDNGAVYNTANNDEETPVFVAEKNGNLGVVEYLVDKGADINTANKFGNTPLHIAARYGRFDVVKYLVEENEADVEATNNKGETPVYIASQYGKYDVVEYLVEVVEEKEADFNTANKDGETPVYIAAKNGKLDVLKYLVEDKEADFETANKDEETPVYIAAKNGRLGVVKYLVEEIDADFNTANNKKETPVYIAAKNGKLEVVKYLVEDKKADFKTTNNEGFTPVSIAKKNHKDKIVEFLIWQSASCEVKKYLVEEKEADIKAAKDHGDTPVHVAARNGRIDVVEYLVEVKEADFKTANNNRETPVFVAAQYGRLDVIKYLVDKGADINTANKYGCTPVHVAASEGHKDILEFLADKVNLNQANKDGQTPVYIAAKNGKVDVVKYLVEENEADFKTVSRLDVLKYLVDEGIDFEAANMFDKLVQIAKKNDNNKIVAFLNKKHDENIFMKQNAEQNIPNRLMKMIDTFRDHMYDDKYNDVWMMHKNSFDNQPEENYVSNYREYPEQLDSIIYDDVDENRITEEWNENDRNPNYLNDVNDEKVGPQESPNHLVNMTFEQDDDVRLADTDTFQNDNLYVNQYIKNDIPKMHEKSFDNQPEENYVSKNDIEYLEQLEKAKKASMINDDDVESRFTEEWNEIDRYADDLNNENDDKVEKQEIPVNMTYKQDDIGKITDTDMLQDEDDNQSEENSFGNRSEENVISMSQQNVFVNQIEENGASDIEAAKNSEIALTGKKTWKNLTMEEIAQLELPKKTIALENKEPQLIENLPKDEGWKKRLEDFQRKNGLEIPIDDIRANSNKDLNESQISDITRYNCNGWVTRIVGMEDAEVEEAKIKFEEYAHLLTPLQKKFLRRHDMTEQEQKEVLLELEEQEEFYLAIQNLKDDPTVEAEQISPIDVNEIKEVVQNLGAAEGLRLWKLQLGIYLRHAKKSSKFKKFHRLYIKYKVVEQHLPLVGSNPKNQNKVRRLRKNNDANQDEWNRKHHADHRRRVPNRHAHIYDEYHHFVDKWIDPEKNECKNM